jgi:hypothetical protein
LDFPQYLGDDPMVWLDRVVQHFAYQSMPDYKRVIILAAFHLGSQANQWWQWMKKDFGEEQLANCNHMGRVQEGDNNLFRPH